MNNQKQDPAWLTILGLIELIFCIVGIVAYFMNNMPFWIVYAAALVSILYSVCNVIFGKQNNLGMEFTTVIVGIVIALIFHLQMLSTIAIFLCIGSVAALVFGWIGALIMLITFR